MDRPDLELLRGGTDIHAHTGRALFERHIDNAAIVQNRPVGGLDPHLAEAVIRCGANGASIPANHSRYHAESFSMPDDQPLGRPRMRPTVAGDETP